MSASRALLLATAGGTSSHPRVLLIAAAPLACRSATSSSSALASRRSYSSARRPDSSGLAPAAGTTSSTSRERNAVSHLPLPRSIAAYLDEYVVGQDSAKRALAVGVFNHYIRVAASSRTAPTQSPPAAKARAKKLAQQVKGGEDEEAILSDFLGQTKGSKRWGDGGRADTGGALASSQSSLSPNYFSSLRPGELDGDRVMSEPRPSSSRANKTVVGRGSTTELEKSNIILIGPSGSGKTHLVRTLSSSLSVPFVHIDATPLTSAGYVGEDVESIMSRLLEASQWNVEEAERGIVCIDEVDKLASPASSTSSSIKTAGRDVGGTGVQQALLRLLEGTVVSIADKRAGSGHPASAAALAPGNTSAMARRSSGGAGTGGNKPWWSPEMQSLNAEHARTISHAREGSAEGVEARKRPTSLSSGSDGTGTVRIDTSKVLFVLCGAFVGLQDIIAARGGTRLEEVEAEDLTAYGLIPEFVGRLPVMVTLQDLTESDLARILTEPRNALVSQYQSLFAAYNIKLHFTTAAIASLARQAAQSSASSSGARMLRRLMERRLLDAMYDGPGGGARYALMDESAAQGLSLVQLFSRGHRSAWLNAIDEEEERHKRRRTKKQSGDNRPPVPLASAANPGSGATAPVTLRRSQAKGHAELLGPAAIDEATLRRRARARLTRPSRVGNLRILTSEE